MSPRCGRWRRSASHPLVAALAALMALAAAACGDAGPRGGPAANRDGADRVGVRVWFQRGEVLVPVERPEVTASPRQALEALLAGPTAEERARGLGSWFGPETADLLWSASLDDGRVTVDFDPRLAERIPNAATSAGSAALLAMLDSTVFQFPDVGAAEYRLGGSCAAFWEWLQRGCQLVRR